MRGASTEGDIPWRGEPTNWTVDCWRGKRGQIDGARLWGRSGRKGEELRRRWGTITRSKEENMTKYWDREKEQENRMNERHRAFTDWVEGLFNVTDKRLILSTKHRQVGANNKKSKAILLLSGNSPLQKRGTKSSPSDKMHLFWRLNMQSSVWSLY